MDKLLALALFLLGVVVVFTTFFEGAVAVLLATACASIVVITIRSQDSADKLFLTRIFIIALLARLSFGLIIHLFDLRNVFGGDALTYDEFGKILMDYWFGILPEDITESVLLDRMNGVGWGMLYLVAGLYSIIGRNILAAQFFCAVIGAAIAPLIYTCSFKIFNNRRSAQVAAILVALYPAFIIWTGQLMKDGLIIFLLVLAMIMILRLQNKFSYVDVAILIFSLFGIISLRFYIFYMITVAIVGTFLVGYGNSSKSILGRIVILAVIGISLTYLGVFRYAGAEFDKYGTLENIQRSREDAANSSDSGFGQGIDVSTTAGAITAIPLGLTYLMLAPFPWQISNIRQAITLPDMLIWWASIPLLISGLIYSIRKRLRGSLGILIFSMMLSIVYSVFQGNVGTAYRQRTQIQVFLFIFIGVGWTLYLERKENEKIIKAAKNREFDKIWREKRKNYFDMYVRDEEIEFEDNIKKDRSIETSSVETNIKEIPVVSVTTERKKEKEETEHKEKKKIKSKRTVFRANKIQIKQAQKLLKDKGFYNGDVTGKFNKEFRSAIKKYQFEQNIKRTGSLNKLTLEKLEIELTKNQKEIN